LGVRRWRRDSVFVVCFEGVVVKRMEVRFTAAQEEEIGAIVGRYSERSAALIPVLFVAQEAFGTLSPEVLALVAQRLELPLVQVLSVVQFYEMFHSQPVGRHHVQVCQSISCALLGSGRLVAHLEKKLGVRVGETRPDGAFSLSRVECLASCGTAPVMRINDVYHENMASPEAIDAVIDPLMEAAADRKSE